MKRHRGRILNDALENYFSIFDSTRSLATELIRKRKNPVEVLILLCARLWPAPGSEDTELGVLMELEVGHGETEVYARVQA
jgi:hypothetical protein